MKNIILLAVAIAVLASFFASAHPDGLEKVAETLGFIDQGAERTSLLTDYTVPFISQEGVSTAVAGILGIFLMLGLFLGIAAVLKKYQAA